MLYKDQAIGESILWWFRDEYWLHKSIQNIEKSLSNGTSKIFSEKVISVFLGRYSIRRTIQAGEVNAEKFTSELVETGFLNSVKQGQFEKIDQFSTVFKSGAKSSIKSALSKFATLYNPNVYIMFDSRSRRGMHRIRKLIGGKLDDNLTYKEIDNYSNYLRYAKALTEEYEDEKLVSILANVNDSDIRKYLLKNLNAFKLRIVDKWLWLEGYNSIKPNPINVTEYIEIVNSER